MQVKEIETLPCHLDTQKLHFYRANIESKTLSSLVSAIFR